MVKLNRKSFFFNYSITYENNAAFLKIKETLLNSDLSNELKQEKLEESLRNFWKIELDNVIKHNSFSKTDIGLRLLINIFNKLNDVLFEFLNNKKYTNKKPYIKDLLLLDLSLIIAIVISKIIPFCLKYENLNEQPVTSLFKSIGQKFYKEIHYIKYKNWNKMRSSIELNF